MSDCCGYDNNCICERCCQNDETNRERGQREHDRFCAGWYDAPEGMRLDVARCNCHKREPDEVERVPRRQLVEEIKRGRTEDGMAVIRGMVRLAEQRGQREATERAATTWMEWLRRWCDQHTIYYTEPEGTMRVVNIHNLLEAAAIRRGEDT